MLFELKCVFLPELLQVPHPISHQFDGDKVQGTNDKNCHPTQNVLKPKKSFGYNRHFVKTFFLPFKISSRWIQDNFKEPRLVYIL